MPPDQSGESWRDAALLLDMALAAEDALSFVANLDERAFLASDLYQSAVIRKLEVIGEAAGRVSKSLRAAHAEIPFDALRLLAMTARRATASLLDQPEPLPAAREHEAPEGVGAEDFGHFLHGEERNQHDEEDRRIGQEAEPCPAAEVGDGGR
jgi:hypothetical protein